MANKNKILLASLSSVFALGLAFTLVNQGNLHLGSKADVCQHDLKHYDAVASSVDAAGNYAYYICCKCHSSFYDAEATKKIGVGKPVTPKRIAEPTNAALKTLNSSKIKFMDQSQYFTDIDNTGNVEYVEIAGKEAIRFSQSKSGYAVTKGSTAADYVGKNNYADGQAPSEFRFTLDKTRALESFEYDYLYWDVTDDNLGSDTGVTNQHVFFQVNAASSVDYHEVNNNLPTNAGTGTYVPFTANLENAKGEWDVANLSWKHVKVTLDKSVKAGNFITKLTGFTGEIYVANPVATYYTGTYDAATGTDASSGTTVAGDFQLTSGTAYDALPRELPRNVGISNTAYVNNNHIWGKYNYAAMGGLDITVPFKYAVDGSDSYVLYYLYNGKNEDGVVVRLNSNRSDGTMTAYIYVMNSSFTSADTNIVAGAGNPGTFFAAYNTGITDGTDAYLRIRSRIVDKATNKVATTAYVGVQGVDNDIALTGIDSGNTGVTEVTAQLGANYLDNEGNNYFRVSMISPSTDVATRTTINQSYNLPTRVVLKGEDGTVYGTKSVAAGSTFALPKMAKSGQKFMGWYNQVGTRYTNATPINGEVNLTARFTEERTTMLLPSDYGVNGVTFTPTSDAETANQISDASKLAGTTRLDVYANYKNNEVGTGDSYVVFGFPYDFINAKSRVNFRFATRDTMLNFSGYFYGSGSLGGAGSDGTYYSDTTFHWNFDHNFLIHMFIETVDAGAGTYNVGAELVDLATGAKVSISKQATLETGDACYSMSEARYNRFNVSRQYGSGSFTVTDPFVL